MEAATVSRNAPCPCGSGRRYKHCCGDETGMRTRDLAFEALAQRRYAESERLFRAALVEDPDDLASLHQLGVAQREGMRYRDALATLLQAAERTGWQVDALREDLAKTVALLRGGAPPADVAILREQARASLAANEAAGSSAGVHGTAIVVLGMHRSGTSALTRMLALAGAELPALLEPEWHDNPKGFWESPAVIALDDALLAQLGGDWRNPPAVDALDPGAQSAFARDLEVFLRTGFAAGANRIVLKDPRMALLAPAWDAALRTCGWRPAWVVPVRDPLEVARSLAARSGMTIAAGLALCGAYLERIERFATGRDDVVFVRSDALLADWRATLRHIDDALDLGLDLDAAAAEALEFLDPALYHQRAAAADWTALANDAAAQVVRARYERMLARCGQAADAPIASREPFAADPRATAAFVLCIEANGIREQALLLAESIRRWGGRHRDAPILAYAPRPGLGVDAATRARLARLRVDYFDAPLNTSCAEYGSANRVFAAADAEQRVDSDFLVVLDSDTVFLGELVLPASLDAVVRVVDVKGSATTGPGDRFEPYWESLAALAGTPLSSLPFVATTVSNERVRASYNGGLVVARRSLGLMRRWAVVFEQSVARRLRPWQGSGHDVHASTGSVGTAAAEWWGSNQAALALVLWSGTARVGEYSSAFNLPLHLVADDGAIAAHWRATPPVHVHYHWLFAQGRHADALALLRALGVPHDRLAWLSRRLPLDDQAPRG